MNLDFDNIIIKIINNYANIDISFKNIKQEINNK